MSELELLRKENMRLKQDIEHYQKQQKEMTQTILILKTKIIEMKNHQVLGIDEDMYEEYCKTLKRKGE
jgi:hypothetical protein